MYFPPKDCINITIFTLKSSVLRNMSNYGMVLMYVKTKWGIR